MVEQEIEEGVGTIAWIGFDTSSETNRITSLFVILSLLPPQIFRMDDYVL